MAAKSAPIPTTATGSTGSAFTEESFQAALRLRRWRAEPPEFVTGNRGEPVRSVSEEQLTADALQWFADLEAKVEFYRGLGVDLDWLVTWTKKYWWSWLTRDMSVSDELYTQDVRWKDVSSFGRTMVGIPEFIKYNFCFFDAIPDWRYDPLLGQLYLDVTPEGRVSFAVRYIGSGHWDGPLRLYPYDDGAPAIPGTGRFVQVSAVDRYHFTEDGLMSHGETLFDIIDGLQSSLLLPRDDSWQFRSMMSATGLGVSVRKLLGPLGGLRG